MLSIPVKTGRQIYTISSELKRKIGHICYILIYFYFLLNCLFIFYFFLVFILFFFYNRNIITTKT